MRSKFLMVTACVLVTACGGPQTSQANSPQANISNDSRPAGAVGSSVRPANAMVMLAVPSVSGAQAAAIMKTRQDGMKAMGNDLKTLHRDLDSDDPNMAAVRSAAADIAKKSKEASGWFPAGTGPEAGKTAAKPDIWQNQQDFAAKLGSLQKIAQQFYSVALAGDANTLKANADNLAGACKACHDKYRMELKH